jgi:hypothetical protein
VFWSATKGFIGVCEAIWSAKQENLSTIHQAFSYSTTTVRGQEVYYSRATMAQSSRATRRGQKKRRVFPTNVVPSGSPSFSTGSTNVPSTGSGVATTISSVERHTLLARHQAQDSKYPFGSMSQDIKGPSPS